MEPSILISTKKILGLGEDYTAFDLDIVTHINAALSVVNQLGLGSDILVEDNSATWAMLLTPDEMTNIIKTYVYLRVRLLFDPPTTSFLKDALEGQLREYEWRLNTAREYSNSLTDPDIDAEDYVVIDGGTP